MKKENIKIMLIGDGSYEMYSKAFYHAWRKLGYNILFIRTERFLNPRIENGGIQRIYGKMENKLSVGHDIKRINHYVIRKFDEFKPDLVFIYSSRFIYPKTIKNIKLKGGIIFLYNNDDPFGNFSPKYFWRHYKNSLKYADVGFAYRTKNIEDYKKRGCKRAKLLRSYYIAERNFPMDVPNKLGVPKVVFLGHYEEDERQDYIKALTDEKISVGIPRYEWEDFEKKNHYIIKLEDAQQNYNLYLNEALIAIVFLSKINHDTYTRRCFEIPATKTLMIAPYTDDIAGMFEEDKEVVFYRNKEEFISKIKYYLDHADEREKIAIEGYNKIIKAGHETADRINEIMLCYKQIKSTKERK